MRSTLLLNDEYAPITSEIGFVRAPVERVVEKFIEWRHGGQKHSFTRKEIAPTLRSSLQSLFPLSSVEPRRFLFVPAENGWTAYFDNSWTGTDATSISHLCLVLKSMALRIVAVPHTKRKNGGRYGATILEVYGPEKTDFLNYIRTIAVSNDGGKWVFHESGNPYDFEDLQKYENKKIADRFNFQDLRAYLEKFGVNAFDEDFYLPGGTRAILLERIGSPAKGTKEYSFNDIRSRIA